MADKIPGSEYRTCPDADHVEQFRKLAVDVAAEFGDDRIGEAGEHRAGLVDPSA